MEDKSQMYQPGFDKNVREVLDEHKQRLLLQIDELRAQGVLLRTKLAQKEIELIEVHGAKAAIDAVRPDAEQIVASAGSSHLNELQFAKAAEESIWQDDDDTG
jgi:hypothetical protein